MLCRYLVGATLSLVLFLTGMGEDERTVQEELALAQNGTYREKKTTFSLPWVFEDEGVIGTEHGPLSLFVIVIV